MCYEATTWTLQIIPGDYKERLSSILSQYGVYCTDGEKRAIELLALKISLRLCPVQMQV